jgi:hypothetical protein
LATQPSGVGATTVIVHAMTGSSAREIAWTASVRSSAAAALAASAVGDTSEYGR